MLRALQLVKVSAFSFFVGSIIVAFASFGLFAVTTAEEVKPLDDFCAGLGDKAKETTVCIENTEDAGGASLLAPNGIVDRIFKLISWLTGMLAVVFIMVGGFKFATSGGNKDSVKSARNMIIYAMVGFAVILLSNLIFNIIIGAVKGTG